VLSAEQLLMQLQSMGVGRMRQPLWLGCRAGAGGAGGAAGMDDSGTCFEMLDIVGFEPGAELDGEVKGALAVGVPVPRHVIRHIDKPSADGYLARTRPTQSNRQLDSHRALPPNYTASWTHRQPSYPIKPPAGLTPAMPPNQSASWTQTQSSNPLKPPAGLPVPHHVVSSADG
jgi:hypothetical protein